MTMVSLAVIVLTYNEERHLGRCLASVAAIASQVFVVDSYSTDRTVAIAREHGARVLENAFVNQAKQFQWALHNAPITADWIMRLDADEVVEADLAREIAAKLPTLSVEVAGVNLKRKHIFMGRWVRHGGRYPLVLLRIWRRGQGRIENRWMDEHIVVWGGRTVTFGGGFRDHNLNGLTFFTDKHNQYATREALELLNQRLRLFARDEGVTADATSVQTYVKRLVKVQLYNRLPFTVSALGYFLYRYVFRLGFLDGRPGLVYHFLQGYWYRFLVGAKVMELEGAVSHLSDKAEIVSELSRLTGRELAG